MGYGMLFTSLFLTFLCNYKFNMEKKEHRDDRLR